MKIVNTIREMKELRPALNGPVGFVPTMGYLHEGHLSLIRKAIAENSSVVVSIFVNPAQFDSKADLNYYPRDTQRDIKMLTEEGASIAFMPEVAEMYPPDFDTWVEVGSLSGKLEGAFRPAHFRGVATVLTKLFNIVKPDRVYFGQKDAQQAIIVKKMVNDLNMDTMISIQPTVREASGLAMSSRNTRLSQEERQRASIIHQALNHAEKSWKCGETDATKIKEEVAMILKNEPLIKIDYISIADAVTLDELERIERPAFVLITVRMGETRLLDNILLG